MPRHAFPELEPKGPPLLPMKPDGKRGSLSKAEKDRKEAYYRYHNEIMRTWKPIHRAIIGR